MQKAMVWAVVVALVWLGVQAMPANAQDVIRIKVGRELIDDPNKREFPIPDFWYGEPFVIEVEWVGPAAGLMLTLSDFRLVSLDPNADFRKDEVVWAKDPDFVLELQDEEGNPIPNVSLSFSEAEKDPAGELVSTKSVILAKIGDRELDNPPRPMLVLFKQTLAEVLFEIDPPWAGKPPTG